MDWKIHLPDLKHECEGAARALSDAFGDNYTFDTNGKGLWFAHATIRGAGITVQASTPSAAARLLLEELNDS
jgi:type 1 glutamine amidotransferase